MAGGENTRQYDIVVFGATGFTGQFVVDEVARLAAKESALKWAVAGRKMEKLQEVLAGASKRTGMELDDQPIILADVANEQSLLDMCAQTKVLLNCVGPYRFYGEQLVKACVESGAHHLDISGEPQFLEKVQLLYHAKAKEAGVYILGTCGFDSIPADMGVIYTQQNFPGDLNSVESFFDVTSGPVGVAINVTTLESAVYGVAHAGELTALRKSLYPAPLPKPAHRPKKRSPVFYSEEVDKWCVPFMGSDKSVVYRTQRYNFEARKQRPVQFSPYFCRPSAFATFLTVVFGILFAIMGKFSFTRNLLLKYPSFFTAGIFKKGGPTKEQIETTGFTMTFFGSGYSTKLSDPEAQHEEPPNLNIVTKVTGPEPGYVTTPICLVQAAAVLLKEKSKLPPGGGVYTPGVAFADTDLIKRLDECNIKFQLVKVAE